MPSPKNRLKLTGDTHLPDPRYDFASDDVDRLTPAEEEVLAPRIYADGYVPPAADAQAETSAEPATMKDKAVEKAAQVESRSPWLAIGAMLAFGFLVAKILR